jgi:hypothetical protein
VVLDILRAVAEASAMARSGRWRSRVELAVGLALGTLLYNLHPTRVGNPLTSISTVAESGRAEGISVEGRVALYGALAVVGALLLVAALVSRRVGVDVESAAAAGRAAGVLTLAGLAGLALDYRDGPQAWVHLAVFVTTALTALRVARLLHAVGRTPGDRS